MNRGKVCRDGGRDYCEHRFNVVGQCQKCNLYSEDIPKVPTKSELALEIAARAADLWSNVKPIIEQAQARDEEITRLKDENHRLKEALEKIASVELHVNTVDRRLREWNKIAMEALKDG